MKTYAFTPLLAAALSALPIAIVATAPLLKPPSLETVLSEVPGKFVCPGLTNMSECAEVVGQRFHQQHPDVVTRENDASKIRLLDGRTINVSDADGPSEPMELVGSGRFLVMWESIAEDEGWTIVDRARGEVTHLLGYPLFSPGFTRFVVLRAAGMQPATLAIFGMGPGGVQLQYECDWIGIWDPSNPRWRGENTVTFTVLWRSEEFGEVERRIPAALRRRNDSWRFEGGAQR